jgi:hypothetical protein
MQRATINSQLTMMVLSFSLEVEDALEDMSIGLVFGVSRGGFWSEDVVSWFGRGKREFYE